VQATAEKVPTLRVRLTFIFLCSFEGNGQRVFLVAWLLFNATPRVRTLPVSGLMPAAVNTPH
jgi:hypothetical protein